MSKWIFENMPVITYQKNSYESRGPPDRRRHHDRVTPAPHISPRCPRRKNCRRCLTRRAGGLERRPPGDGSLPPWERGGSARTEGFTASSEAFPTRGVAPTLTSRQHLTTVNVKIFTPISRYNPPNFNIKFSTLKSGHFFKKSEKKYLTDPNLQSNKKIVKPERDRRFYTNSI